MDKFAERLVERDKNKKKRRDSWRGRYGRGGFKDRVFMELWKKSVRKRRKKPYIDSGIKMAKLGNSIFSCARVKPEAKDGRNKKILYFIFLNFTFYCENNKKKNTSFY